MCRRHAFTIIELMFAVAILAILGAMLAPSATPAVEERLRAVNGALVADLDYARNLAVNNNSSYRVEFDTANNRYTIEHVGTNPALDTLPPHPFASATGTATQHVIPLANLPAATGVQLMGAELGQTMIPVTEIEFGPLGETTETEEVQVWCVVASGDLQRFGVVTIDPVSGLATAGPVQSSGPGGLGMPGGP